MILSLKLPRRSSSIQVVPRGPVIHIKHSRMGPSRFCVSSFMKEIWHGHPKICTDLIKLPDFLKYLSLANGIHFQYSLLFQDDLLEGFVRELISESMIISVWCSFEVNQINLISNVFVPTSKIIRGQGFIVKVYPSHLDHQGRSFIVKSLCPSQLDHQGAGLLRHPDSHQNWKHPLYPLSEIYRQYRYNDYSWTISRNRYLISVFLIHRSVNICNISSICNNWSDKLFLGTRNLPVKWFPVLINSAIKHGISIGLGLILISESWEHSTK